MDLNHLHLMVANLDKSKEFYVGLFGFREKASYGPDLLFIQNASGFDLALTPSPSVQALPKGIHFGFSVADHLSLLEMFEKVKTTSPESLTQAAPSNHGDWGSFVCLDPDEYTIEVYWDSNLHGT